MPLITTDQDSNYLVQDINLARKVDKLPAAVYNLMMSEEGPRLFKGRTQFEIPKDPLGDHCAIRDLIISDYNSTTSPVGVILVGLKGSGKTMLSEDLCNLVLDSGRPVLNITTPLPGGLISTIINLLGPCAVLFDEFGKVYNESEERNSVLTLFSDSEKRNILFIVTANSEREFVDAMLNRPGRFKYRINYDGIKEATIIEALANPKHSPELVEYLRMYSQYHAISFDMLLLMKKLLSKCVTPADFINKIEFYNLPKKVNVRYTVKEVTFNNSATDYRGWLDESEAGLLTLEITENKTGAVVHSQPLVWASTEKVKRAAIWHLKIDDGLKIGVERDVTEHVFKERKREAVGASQHRFGHPDDDIEYNNPGYPQSVKQF